MQGILYRQAMRVDGIMRMDGRKLELMFGMGIVSRRSIKETWLYLSFISKGGPCISALHVWQQGTTHDL
jgi:hypothetical protein